MLIPIAEQIWNAKYRFSPPDRKPERTIEDTWRRVAEAAASVEPERSRKFWEQRFFDALADFAFIPAGRILSGAGTGRAVTLFNCFVMGGIGDDMGSIFANVREAALSLQLGGGIGHDFSTLRPKGTHVRGVGADASGPVSFMDVWDAMCRTIMSAGARRGAMMGTMRCDHPDIEAFIEAKADPGRLRNFNLSVLVTDAFMEAVKEDRPWPLVFGGEVYRTISAQGLWRKIMRSAYDYAEPGVIFIDRVNTLNNLSYCETISCTNPCVTEDTWVHTSEGPRQVSALIGRSFYARINGEDHFSPNGFFNSGRKPTVCLETAEGFELKLTPDHLVKRAVKQNRSLTETEWCAVRDLSAADKIVLNNHRGRSEWPGNYTYGQGYLIGLLVGDGTLKKDKAVLSVWINPQHASGARSVMDAAMASAATLKHRSDFRGWSAIKGRNEHRLALGAIKALAEDLGMAPGAKTATRKLEEASSAFYKGFLRGFFDSDGSIQGSQVKGVSVRLAQSNLNRLKAVQRMLLRLGIMSRIYQNRRPATIRNLPDGKGSTSPYSCQADHELVVSGDNLLHFRSLVGFSDTDKSARLDEALGAYKRKLNRECFVASVKTIRQEEVRPVYDVQIPGINAFDANGMYVHNCGEQPLPPYGACLLGSVNLAALIEEPFSAGARLKQEKLEDLVPVAVRLLDNIIEVSRFPLPQQENEAKAKRRIGLGVTGLADALIMCGVHYGSEEGRGLAASWMSKISHAAYVASAGLAKEKGAFPLFSAEEFLRQSFPASLPSSLQKSIADNGLRNGLLTSIAPTGTISLLAGNVSSGIEPVFDFEYRRRILSPGGAERHETVRDYAAALFRDMHGGAPLPPAFVTAHDLSPGQHLLMQAALQRHVDASISKTVNCPETIAFEDFEMLYLDAYRLGLKGCTAYRPNEITGAVLSAMPAATGTGKAVQPALPLAAADAVPRARDTMLAGFTYKLKWPGSDHAIYVTINDTFEHGQRRPFEIFINSKNLEHYAWTVALTRMISAIFRRGGDVSFVVEELKAVFDPRGGTWTNGRYVPSLLAAIGDIIEQHFLHIGFQAWGERENGVAQEQLKTGKKNAPGFMPLSPSDFCPRCGSPSMIYQEGCRMCRNCGYSTCG